MSDCIFSECCCDGESPSVYNRTMPTAQKQHLCCECGGAIQPGEKYERVEGLWDGKFSTFKTCPDCLALLCENEPCRIYGGLRNALREIAEIVPDDPHLGQFLAYQAARRANLTPVDAPK